MTWSNARRVLHLVEGKWTLPILAHLRQRAWRLSDLRRSLEGEPAAKILQASLRHLEDNGLAQRHVISTSPPHVTYMLTLRGRALVAVLDEAEVWATAVMRTDGERT